MKLWKNFVFAVVVTVLTASCGNYKLATGSDIIYLDQGQEVTSMFTDYDVDIIRLQFTTITPRFHYNRPYYYYWHNDAVKLNQLQNAITGNEKLKKNVEYKIIARTGL